MYSSLRIRIAVADLPPSGIEPTAQQIAWIHHRLRTNDRGVTHGVVRRFAEEFGLELLTNANGRPEHGAALDAAARACDILAAAYAAAARDTAKRCEELGLPVVWKKRYKPSRLNEWKPEHYEIGCGVRVVADEFADPRLAKHLAQETRRQAEAELSTVTAEWRQILSRHVPAEWWT